MTAINTNTAALNAQYYLSNTNKDMESSMAKLSSGQKVNSAADDAAGLAIASRMTAQIRGLAMAVKNSNDSMSLAQTAEGAMEEVTNMLQRIRELAVQSANGTMNAGDRSSLDAEVQALKAEIDRVATTTTFNNQKLLDGSYKSTFQIGDKAGQTVGLKIGSVLTSSLGMGEGAAGANSVVSARIAIAAVDAGDIMINGQALGAITTSDDMEDIINNISDNVDNVTATGFNVVTAKQKGNGVTADGDLEIKVAELGVPAADATTYKISASSSMEELAANINAETGGVVQASVNDDGKLVLSNNTGATINVQDTGATAGAYDGGSGFLGDTTGTFGAGTAFAGFLRLSSNDDNPVRVEAGNKGLAIANVGSSSDLEVLGFRQTQADTVADGYTMVGNALTAAGAAATWAKGDLTINGVEIYDENLVSTSFTDKLTLLNSKSAETGVVASASFNKAFGIDTNHLDANGTFRLNGHEITLTDGTISGLVDDINTAKATTGITAEYNGNNVTLKGENIQTLTVGYATTVEVNDGLTSAADAATTTAATAMDITIDASDVIAGRTFTVSSTGGTGTAFSVTHTVTTTDTATTVADAIVAALRADATVGADMRDAAGSNVSNAAGVISIAAAGDYGDSTLAVEVSAMPAIFGTAATHYASIKLDSVNNNPIKIDLGDSAAAAAVAGHGFIESNVGAADFDVNEPTMSASGGQSMSGLTVASAASATEALGVIDNAIDTVNSIRGNLGAIQNRLEYTINNLSSISNATSGARGRILDADFAKETSELTKHQILSQAATSMLAQANQSKQGILALLQG
ncbi:flagellin [Alphaproteobacteria bacterium LSUCC0719]